MAFHCGPRFGVPVTSGLILALDASNPISYPGAGSVWYDTSQKKAHATIVGSITYVKNEKQSYFNYAIANDANYIFSSLAQNYADVTVIFQPDFTNTKVFAYLFGQTGSVDRSLRFTNVVASPWNVPNPGNFGDWSSGTATTYYLNGSPNNSTVSVSYSGWNIISGYKTNTAFPSTFVAYIGAGYLDRGFQGKIAAVFAYDRQLTPEEQLLNHEAFKFRFNIP